jgi:hypothetical protein
MSWLKQILGFWNKICARPDDDLVKIAMKEAIDLAAKHNVHNCWCSKLNCALGHMGASRVRQLERIDVKHVMGTVLDKWHTSLWSRLPTLTDPVRDVLDSQRGGFRLYVYQRWFAIDNWEHNLSFMHHLFDRDQITAVAQFRMGVHWLNTVCMPRTVPRSMRACPFCGASSSRAREDEMHIFECPHYADLRGYYNPTVSSHHMSDVDMKMMLNGGNNAKFWSRFANFLIRCRDRRSISVDAT